jgi:hypothetical protein
MTKTNKNAAKTTVLNEEQGLLQLEVKRLRTRVRAGYCIEQSKVYVC